MASQEQKRNELERIANQLADCLGIDPEYVMVEPRTGRISISAKQAARIVKMLTEEKWSGR